MNCCRCGVIFRILSRRYLSVWCSFEGLAGKFKSNIETLQSAQRKRQATADEADETLLNSSTASVATKPPSRHSRETADSQAVAQPDAAATPISVTQNNSFAAISAPAIDQTADVAVGKDRDELE